MPTRKSQVRKKAASPKRTIARIHAQREKVSQAALRHAAENFRYNCRLDRVTSRRADTVVKRAFRAAGIDAAEFERKHESDAASMMKFARQQRSRTLAAAKMRAERQVARIDQARSDFAEAMSRYGVALQTAYKIEHSGMNVSVGSPNFSRSQPFSSSIGELNNVAELDSSVYTEKNSCGSSYDEVRFRFQWQSDRTAPLRSSAMVQVNGGWQLELPPPGHGNKNRARVYLDAKLYVDVVSSDGTARSNLESDARQILDRECIGEGSYGYVYYDQLSPFDDELRLSAPDADVLPGDVVEFTVIMRMIVEAVNKAGVDVDLATGPYRINVPRIRCLFS